MNDVLQTFQEYLSLPFVRYAFVVVTLIALCSSLLGVTLVLKRFSFIGDGLSHVAFGAMAVASVLKLSGFENMLVVMPLTVVSAVLILKTGTNTKINGDASIAMISAGSLAVGYMLMNKFPSSSNISSDVCSTLFGSSSILTLKSSDVLFCTVMAVAVLGVFVLLYHKIFSVTFDENFASATGVNADRYNLLIAIITAVVIVTAMNLVGSLLISALIIFPPLSAMRVFKSFRSVMICSAVTAVVCSSVGIAVSILLSTPVGATIVCADIVSFAVFSAISKK